MTRKRQRAVEHTMKLPTPGPSQCHPGNKEYGAHGCLPLKVLLAAASKLGISSSGRAADLRSALEDHLQLESPVGERSFLMKLPLPDAEKTALAKKYLRPAAPAGWKSDPDMWLNTNDIANVLNQYEEAYPDFEFMGPFPIDFAAPDPYVQPVHGGGQKKCLMNEICELRVTKALSNGTKGIGIVYNLDPHFKSGSHWVANYIDIPGHACYYFDSYGIKPPEQVERFMKWLTTQDPKMKLEYNARKLQTKNTECGVYCIYFIARMLLGDKFKEFTHRNPNDQDMLDLRDWVFST